MQELLVLSVALTAIAVLVSFGYGIYALRLAALNLLEPTVTIAVLGGAIALLGSNDDSAAVVLLIAGIPLTSMLLAPLLNPRAAQPLRSILIMYGVLRWVNTVAFWAMGAATLQDSSSNDKAALAGMLICSGLAILFVSVGHIASSLETVKTQRVQ